MGRLETEWLTQEDNVEGLGRLDVELVKPSVGKTVYSRIILDIDSSESPVHGKQEGATYNRHFGCLCYHPLFCFNQFGDCEGAVLRSGNIHSADGWKEFIYPIVKRYLGEAVRLLFRASAAFAKLEIRIPGIEKYRLHRKASGERSAQEGHSAPVDTADRVAFSKARRLLS